MGGARQVEVPPVESIEVEASEAPADMPFADPAANEGFNAEESPPKEQTQ